MKLVENLKSDSRVSHGPSYYVLLIRTHDGFDAQKNVSFTSTKLVQDTYIVGLELFQ